MPRPSNITPISVCSSRQQTRSGVLQACQLITLFKKKNKTFGLLRRESQIGIWETPCQTMYWSAWSFARAALSAASTGSELNCLFSGDAALNIGSITDHECITQDHLRRERTWKTEGAGQQHALTAACFPHWHHQHHWQEQRHSSLGAEHCLT